MSRLKQVLDQGPVTMLKFRPLLKGALDREVKNIHNFGDSSLVINQRNGSTLLHNILLRPFGDLLWEVATFFDKIHFTHIFRK